MYFLSFYSFCFDFFYAGRICDVGSRVLQSKEFRKYRNEEPDGFRDRCTGFLHRRLWIYVWQGCGSILGVSGFFCPTTVYTPLQGALPVEVYIFFQMMFCATAATIVSGAMAGRTRFVSYLICSACMSAFIFPITGHWIWGGGWLSNLGFHDLAGSSAVHMCGGICAFVGAILVGPRIGKYGKKRRNVWLTGT